MLQFAYVFLRNKDFSYGRYHNTSGRGILGRGLTVQLINEFGAQESFSMNVKT